jgi:SAM-dependent methyltransferase
MTHPRDWDRRAGELSARAITSGRPTAWFDELYAAGDAGEISMPWDHPEPDPLLREWTSSLSVEGPGRRAVVVGCGLGADAEHVATLGFETVGFDLSPTAIEVARRRHAGSPVDYRVADLQALPIQWQGAFDLVVEVYTLQAVPDPPRAAMADAVVGLVAPGGTLIAVAFRDDGAARPDPGPPFPLARGFMEGLARRGLRLVSLEEREPLRWRAVYRRED